MKPAIKISYLAHYRILGLIAFMTVVLFVSLFKFASKDSIFIFWAFACALVVILIYLVWLGILTVRLLLKRQYGPALFILLIGLIGFVIFRVLAFGFAVASMG